MRQAVKQSLKGPPVTHAGSLPPRMRTLYITTSHRTGGWLADALASDRASEVLLEEAAGVTDGMARLRDQVYDAVLISHEPDELDALELIEGLRAGGAEEPLIVLGEECEGEMSALCYEVGADAYVCVNAATIRTLLWVVARAIERHQLIRENRRLQQAERRRLQHEHQEAERLLAEQRGLIGDLETLRASAASEDDDVEAPIQQRLSHAGPPSVAEESPLPDALSAHYRELLRAHVIMGSGNLAGEMAALAEMLVQVGVTAQQTMQLHVQVLEELIRGLGNRSARHVLTRADLLVLEVLVHLTEGYRQRYLERICPPKQLELPGFNSSLAGQARS